MKPASALILALFTLSACQSGLTPPPAAVEASLPGELVVKFQPGTSEAAKAAPVQVIGAKDQIIQQGLTDNGVILVTKGKSPEEAWNTATKTIDNNLDK